MIEEQLIIKMACGEFRTHLLDKGVAHGLRNLLVCAVHVERALGLDERGCRREHTNSARGGKPTVSESDAAFTAVAAASRYGQRAAAHCLACRPAYRKS